MRYRRGLTCLISLLAMFPIFACGGGPSRSTTPPLPPRARLLCIGSVSVFLVDNGELNARRHEYAVERIHCRIKWIQWICLSIESGLPAGTSTRPASPITVAASSSQMFTVASRSSTPSGNSQLTLHATSGSLAHKATITLSINPPARTSQTGTVLYLQSYSFSHTARIGLEMAGGGSIVEVSFLFGEALTKQLNYNLLFRWFVGLEIEDPVWNHAVFSKNRDRLLNQNLAQSLFPCESAGDQADVG